MSAAARLRYFVTDAWEAFRQHPGVTLLATGTLAVVLAVGCAILVVLFNVRRELADWSDEVRVEVYLRDDATEPQRAGLERALVAIPGVQRVVYVPRDEALRRFQEGFPELASVPAELGSNPLPASYDVLLERGPAASRIARVVAAVAAGRPGIEDVRFDQDWIDAVQGWLSAASAGGAGLALLVMAGVAFVMAGVLRLSVLSRQDEIEIMLLVGASPAFARGPFLVSGMLQGCVASLLALGAVELGRRLALRGAGRGASGLLDLLAGQPLPVGAVVAVVATGIVVGLCSAFVAVRRVR